METSHSLQPHSSAEIAPAVETFGTQLDAYLDHVGLPKDSILVPYDRRRPVFQNIPTVLESLAEDQKEAAAYISKFVASCAVGLFDAALNYLWNETIRNLRNKVARFDLAYFFDSVVNDPNRRSKLHSEEDLEKLEDWELIRGCRTTGIITENGFRHLDYVRNMRNFASAAHPNQNDITGLQIVSWLETCITEVLAKEPAGAVIEVRKLLHSLRTQRLSESDMPIIEAALPSLTEDLSESLLRAVYGMYTDTSVDTHIKDNLRLVARSIWDIVSVEARREAGLKQAMLAANGEVVRARLAREFIEIVGGVEFLTVETRAAEMSAILDNLNTAHFGMNNFFTEAAPARLLHRLVPANGSIPKEVHAKYGKTITMCRIGNGHGVSWAGQDYYDDLLSRFSDELIRVFVNLVRDPEVASRLQFRSCASRYQDLSATLETRSVNPRLKEMLSFIRSYPTNQLGSISRDSKYRRLREALRV